jgi:hypothetical protein
MHPMGFACFRRSGNPASLIRPSATAANHMQHHPSLGPLREGDVGQFTRFVTQPTANLLFDNLQRFVPAGFQATQT